MDVKGHGEDPSSQSLGRDWGYPEEMKSLGVGCPKDRAMTLLNCDQDTERCWKVSMLRLLSLKIFWAKKRKCSGSSPWLVPTSAMNLRFRVSHIFSHGTRSATTKGTRSWVKGKGEGASGDHPPSYSRGAFILSASPRLPLPGIPLSSLTKMVLFQQFRVLQHDTVKTGMKRGQKCKNRSMRS